MFDGLEYISGKKAFTGVEKFLPRRPTFWNGTQKMCGKNQSFRPIETQLETFLFVLYYLSRTCSFHFGSATIESFCNEAFVDWMLFQCLKEDAFQRIISVLQTHLSKAIQKNMPKAWHFTENKIYHKCFDNNLQKIFWTKILKNSNGQIILMVTLMVDVWLKPQMEIVDSNVLIFIRPPSLHISI